MIISSFSTSSDFGGSFRSQSLAHPMSFQEQFIRGQSLSPGIAVGVLYFLESELEDVESAPRIAAKGWSSLLEKTRLQLRRQSRIKTLEDMEKSILASQLEILNDPSFIEEVHLFLEEGLNLKEALGKSLSGWKLKFKKIKSVLFQERIFDLQDVVLRLLRVAHVKKRAANTHHSTCLYIKQALPSSILEISREKLAAVICESGSIGSHLAILARSRKLPCLSKVHLPLSADSIPVIVDADEGWLILHPTEATYGRYNQKMKKTAPLREKPQEIKINSLQSSQVSKVRLWANVNSWADVKDVPEDVAGIGLVRTEFFAYEHGSLPSLKTQAQLYTRLVKSQMGKEVVFRLFDFGSDKPLLNRQITPEANPALGCRGVRLLLKEPQILKDQLQALLMASSEGFLSILVPMVCLPQEMQQVRRLMESLGKEMGLSTLPKLGMMVEIPAAAFMIEQFIEESDFFSIGTNDLLQYMYAVDRTNQRVSELYNPMAPSLLHLIDHIVKTCRKHFRRVSLCGEMASDPTCMNALCRLGISDYSISASLLKELRNKL